MATQLRIAYVSAFFVALAGAAASPLACSSPNTGDDSDGTPPNDASTGGDTNNPGDSAAPTDGSTPIVDAGVDAPAPACGGGSASFDAAAPSVANAACCYALVSGTPGYSGSFVGPDSGEFPESTDVVNCCIGMLLYEDQTCAGADASDCMAYANVFHCCPLTGNPPLNTCM